MMNYSAEPVPVLYISGFADIVGGGQRSFLLLLKGLDLARYKPFVVCPGHGEVSGIVSGMGIGVFFLPQPELKSRRFWKAAPYVLSLRRLLRETGALILHCDTIPSALLCGIAAAGSGTRVVFHARVGDSGGIYDRFLSAMCDRLICVSAAVAGRFKGARAAGKVRVVYNGVDTSEFHPGKDVPAFREGYGIPAGAPVIGFCGQLVAGKGLAVIVEAFSLIKARLPEAKLLLAGRGTLEAELKKRFSALGLGNDVIFTGFIANISVFMSAIDVLVQPSFLFEGLSRVLIEAMACGKPVIATEVGGNPETVEDGITGFIIRPGDAEALAEKALLLLKDRKLARDMGNRGLERVLRDFSARGTAEGVERVYDELLAGARWRHDGR